LSGVTHAVDCQIKTARGEALGNAATNAAATAGHECDTFRLITHDQSSVEFKNRIYHNGTTGTTTD
jgi:hypothetical protein